jgi:aspartate dehydrogenase
VPRLGLIGFGAIGRQVVAHLSPEDGELVAILVRRVCNAAAPLHTSLENFLGARPNIVIDAAGPAAFSAYAEAIVETGATLISVSASALTDSQLRHRLEKASTVGRVYFPAGALGGIDALGSAAVGGLDDVSLRITEPGATHAVYSGDALAAVKTFPERLNVAALTALAANHPVHLELRQSPDHRQLELSARGAFGDFSFHITPRRAPHIVALSLIATLRRLTAPISLA